ncbi:hypothetical protein C0995_006392 [Termitomyces sp. Mi166|nr:hypothetical protein C0995_006392 [Termitomyces sp. Mi166\
MRSALDKVKHHNLVTDKGIQHCFKDLKAQAQWEEPIKQIALLQEALSTYCSQSESLPVMASQITDIVKRAFDIGKITMDLFMCIVLLNSLNDPSFNALQNSISTFLSKSTKKFSCKLTDIQLLMENAQNIINSKVNTTTMALNIWHAVRTVIMGGHVKVTQNHSASKRGEA